MRFARMRAAHCGSGVKGAPPRRTPSLLLAGVAAASLHYSIF